MYEVRQRFQLPDLRRFLPAGGAVDRSTEQREVREFDTAGRDLALAGLSLSRTSHAEGGSDWQIRNGSQVIAEASTSAGTDLTPPTDLTDLLLGASRGRKVRQTSSLRTHQLHLVLRDSSGAPLGTITDRQVSGSETSGHKASLTEHRTVLAKAVATGFEGSVKAINKAIAAGGGWPAVTQASSGDSSHRTSKPSAGGALTSYLRTQDSALIAGDLALRQGNFDVVHSLRVAVRRTRSTVKVFARCFPAEAVTTFDDDLRWYAKLLGAVRDSEVLLDRMSAAVGTLSDDLVLGPVTARISQHLTADLLAGQRALTEALGSDRYLQLLARSAEWAGGERLNRAPKITQTSLLDGSRRAARTADRRLRRAIQANDEGAQLHRAHKAAKRARYAAELVQESFGGKASRRNVEQYRRSQHLLGDHQDAVVAAELLRRLGATRGTEAGENGFTYGVLHERELQRAALLRDRIR